MNNNTFISSKFSAISANSAKSAPIKWRPWLYPVKTQANLSWTKPCSTMQQEVNTENYRMAKISEVEAYFYDESTNRENYLKKVMFDC